jgi:hypothetical protein
MVINGIKRKTGCGEPIRTPYPVFGYNGRKNNSYVGKTTYMGREI